MPVPAVITDLSATIALNSPADADSPNLGDDYIRALSAFIRQNYDGLTAGDALIRSDLANTASATLGDFLQGVKRTFTNAVATTGHDVHEAQAINAVAYAGMSTAGSAAANTTAMNVAVAAAAAIGFGCVEIPAGSYAITAGSNFASAGVTIRGIGIAELDVSAGTGLGIKFDAGGSGALVQRMHVENLKIKGGSAITEALYIRGIVRSTFKDIEVKEATTAGIALRFNVLNTFDHCVVSDDTGSMTTRPTHYWYLDDDGSVSNHTQANTFLNCEASGPGAGSTKTGWTLTNAILNVWIGGTSESLGVGIDITSEVCRMNSWHGFDMEDNQTFDAKVKGYLNSFIDSFAQSTAADNIDISTGVETQFKGGYYRKVNLGASSSDTLFDGVMFDDNGARGIQGTGSFKRYSCIENTGGISGNKTGTKRDILGPAATATITGSQNNTPTQTVTLNQASTAGRMCYLQGNIAFTAAGTPANSISIEFEATYAAKASAVGLPVGTFIFNDAGTRYSGVLVLNTSSQFVLTTNTGTGNFGTNPAITIANGDVLTFSANYPME